MKLRIIGLLVAAVMGQAPLHAQTFPDHPIKIVSPGAPGTATDSVARFVADRLGRESHWPTTVENKVGANGIIAMEFAARAQADGYTLLLAPSTLYINKALQPKVSYEISDYAPLAKAAGAYLVLVVPTASPFQTLKDAVAYMQANPGKVNYSTGGSGSVTHLAFAMLSTAAGVQALHVPYKGGDLALTDTISGQVGMTFTAISSAKANIAAGKLRALAVTGPRRSSALPDVPTIAELGYPSYEAVSGLGFMAPKNIAPDLAKRISGEILKIVRPPEFATYARAQGLEVDALDATAYAADGRRELSMWQKAVTESGAKVE